MNRRIVNNIVISPSGNLYGSEYVLYDFLKGSNNSYDIYVPKDSVFYNKLKEEDFNVHGFTNVKMLYVLVFFKMLFNPIYLYINEAGHISYVKVLAKLLPFRKFVVSVRLVEDCNSKLNLLPKNITLISVSNYIKSKINSNLEPIVVYDPYALTLPIVRLDTQEFKIEDKTIRLGVVGRITKSKGGDNLIEILKHLNADEISSLEINFFGTYDSEDKWFINFKSHLDNITDLKYNLKGFVADKEDIYKSVDVLIHLNKEEPLGRILFEAVDYNLPALVYKSGGIGELAEELRLPHVSMADSLQYANELKRLIKEGQFKDLHFSIYKKIITNKFNAKHYCESIEQYL